MKDKMDIFLRDLISALQVAKIYTIDHPQALQVLDRAYETIGNCLQAMPQIIIGIVDNEFIWQEEIFFDLSRKARPLIMYLEEHKVERIIFNQGLKKEELVAFIAALSQDKDHPVQDISRFLHQHNVTHLEVTTLAFARSADQVPGALQESLSYLQRYQNSLDKVSQSIESLLSESAIDQWDLKFAINEMLEHLVDRHQEFLKLNTIKRHDLATFIHLLNVAILSMYFASKLGFAKEDVLSIGLGGLFHDVGKMYISQKILAKPATLSPEEFDKMRSHAILGAEILLNYVDALGPVPVVVAFEHHRRYDLRGYPKVPFLQQPHLATMIVCLCDVYDALSQRRTYKRDYPPNMVYGIMRRERGGLFDPDLFDIFFKFIGIWPRGTIVKLSNDQIAVVRTVNADAITSPIIEIATGPEKGARIDLKTTQDSLTITSALNPLAEGRDFVELI